MAQKQEAVEKTFFTASAGDSAMKAVASSKKDLTISLEVLNPEDAEIVQDIVFNAVNEMLHRWRRP